MYALGGMVWWKAVSKTATCGVFGSIDTLLFDEVDAGVGAGVVQRGEFLAQGELGTGVVVDKGRLAEILAAGNDAVAHGVNGVEALDGGARAAHHHAQQLTQATRNREALHRHGEFLKVGGERDIHESLRGADLLGQALHERGLAVGLDELGLEGGTACVYDEYEHGGPRFVGDEMLEVGTYLLSREYDERRVSPKMGPLRRTGRRVPADCCRQASLASKEGLPLEEVGSLRREGVFALGAGASAQTS